MSVGRWTPRRIASHHLACLARDASRARTTTTRMDDARDATVTIALNACFCAVRAPTAVARTASPSSSGSDARGHVATVAEPSRNRRETIVCARVHELLDACTDEAVTEVLCACARDDAMTLRDPIGAVHDARERRAMDAVTRRRGTVRLIVSEDDESPEARQVRRDRTLDADDAISLAYEAISFNDDVAAKAYLKKATIRDAARERAFAARAMVSCSSVREVVTEDLTQKICGVSPASSAKEMLEQRERKKKRGRHESRDGDSRARASKSPLGSPSRACTARKAS